MGTAREPIAVIGTGYVGLVTAAGFAQLGSEVWCVDIDAEKIARLERGEIPIYEPGLAESIAANRGRLHFSTELAPALEHARLLFVAVGTPPTYSGDADLSAVHAVVDAMPRSDHHALVMKSTVPVGTGAAIRRSFEERGKGGFAYVSCPEFLKEGSALEDFLKPDRVVVGDDGDWAGDAVIELYSPLDAPLVRTDIASAEMIKLAANAFLATKISFINEIANVCEETGADVLEVARGMGLDRRIGTHFLKPGIGFGGSCFHGGETVLARHRGRTTLLTFEQLWRRLAAEHQETEEGLIEPSSLEVLSWVPGCEEPQFLSVMCVTRRDYEGELIEVRTKMGRAVRTTPDHGWIVSDGLGGEPRFKLADELTTEDWVPLALGRGEDWESTKVASLLSAAETAEISPDKLIVRPRRELIDALVRRPIEERRQVFARSASAAARTGDVKRTGSLRWDELALAGLPIEGSTVSTTKNGNYPRSELQLDESFWRVVGLYLAEGCAGGASQLRWSFHPEREEHLVDEVVAYWLRQNVRANVSTAATARIVSVQSRLIQTWFTAVLGLGRNSYGQRLPDLIWEQPDSARWALLSGLFEGDGSWSLINGGPSVIIELGTVSDELAEGVLRLLASVGIVASKRTGRVAKSTKDTHWIRISGADQVERAIRLVPERDRAGALASIARQQKRIAPTGYRRFGDGPAWARVTSNKRQPYNGPVYSLEVPYAHTVVTTGGRIASNCFPKDVSALKQLAGNSGYHFQLLTAVIEVNELQKRRVISKLQKHLGSLVGKTVALLGLAFKANTDDMREASSLVLSARLQADGAKVRAYDPIAEREARKLMGGVEFADNALGAVSGADAVVIVTEWPEFAELDWSQVAERMPGRLVIDGRNFVDPESVRAAGFIYEGIGR
ncbi:MAG TPA: nucleotide sugar dehydrogenase [Solirubrobacteraceae bacterium]|nr:nucleotide sugar dehydrogenase [Solirubrobacteraceae bacterium]